MKWFISTVVVSVITAWLTGFLSRFVPVPPPARVRLALKNPWRNLQHPKDSFRVVLCWLQNDRSGDDTNNVAKAFTGIEGITLVQSARMVTAPGAADEWRPAMQQRAFAVLADWNADVAIVGAVKKPGEVLSLWFVPRLGDGTLDRGDTPYKLENVTLGADFHEDLRAQLSATAMAAVAPLADTEARGRMLDRGLRNAVAKLSNLLEAATINMPEHRAALHVTLGNALFALGEREAGPERLEQAIDAFQAALQVYTIKSMPFDWAMTQNNLGVAFARLGEREAGPERLERAIDVFQAALQVYTRERVPLDWAGVQNNLGNALARLGEREAGPEHLEQGIDAYRAVLEVYTRERVPLGWAGVQHNLGNVLARLGKGETGPERLEQAVDAYRAALQERSRERVPLDWAMTQNNLGVALKNLGEREAGPERLEQAVDAYRAALQERSREPLDWAGTQNNLPLDWAGTQNNLGVALMRLGEREAGPERLEQAVDAYRAALEVYTRERVPLDWAGVQNNLGVALESLAGREAGPERLEQAVDAYRAALEVFNSEESPRYRDMVEKNLRRVLKRLHKLRP